MKTIKQLEKEIEEVRKIMDLHSISMWKIWEINKDREWLDSYNKEKELKEQLQTLQEVCKEIDKQIKNYQKLNKKFPKNQTFVDMWTALFALQLRLEGEE